MLVCAMLLGLAGSVVLSVISGSPDGSLPGVALGSAALLIAERAAALFGIWMAVVMIVVRTFRDQLPVEVSGRGVRYADAEDVQMTTASVEEALRGVNADLEWLREVVTNLQLAERDRKREDDDVR